jgi:branched-chain amino acid transport system substrate-binding protein
MIHHGTRRWFFFLLVLLVCGWISACGPKPPAPGATGAATGVFGFGFAAPLTGDNAQFGTMQKRGVQLAIEEINAAGGLKGKQVTGFFEDDAANPREAGTVAQKLASNSNVYAVLGHFNSSCSLAGKPKYAEGEVLQLTPASTNVRVCKGSPWTFRNIYDDAFQGATLARYAKEVLGLKKVAIFFDNDDYGIGLKDSFLKQANAEGLFVVSVQSFGRETSDYRPHLSKFGELKPEAIMIAGLYSQAALIARQARESGIVVPILAGDGVLSEEYIKLAQEASDNTYISTPFLFELGGEKAQRFRKTFEKKYGVAPDAWSALAYDAVYLVAEGVKKAGWNRQGIRDYLAGVTTKARAFPGITGATFFDVEGDCKKPIHMALVKGGKILAAPKQLH